MEEVGQAPATSRVIPLGDDNRSRKGLREGDSGARSLREHAGQGQPVSAEGQDKVTLSREAQLIMELASGDRRVRAHEAAHSAAGGQYAGSPSYSYRQGPDGKRYAVAGEVSIDASPVSGNPEATIKKAQTVRAAALAPADPSPQDRQVAAAALQMGLAAQAELQAATRKETSPSSNEETQPDQETNRSDAPADPKTDSDSKQSISWYA